jgi:hypothetical protein
MTWAVMNGSAVPRVGRGCAWFGRMICSSVTNRTKGRFTAWLGRREGATKAFPVREYSIQWISGREACDWHSPCPSRIEPRDLCFNTSPPFGCLHAEPYMRSGATNCGQSFACWRVSIPSRRARSNASRPLSPECTVGWNPHRDSGCSVPAACNSGSRKSTAELARQTGA